MALQEPLAPHLQRCLLFVKLANDGGAYPSAAELDEYARRPEPQPPTRVKLTVALTSTLDQVMTNQLDGQPVATYMRRLGWLCSQDSGLELTVLGQALVTGLAGTPRTTTDRAVVLSPTDPARYEVLVRSMSAAGRGLLADPYLRSDFLDLLVSGTSLSRLLLSSAVNKSDRKLISLALDRLGSEYSEELPEVRVSSDRRFHDRYLLHESGSIDLIGASVNSLDTRVTALVLISGSSSGVMRRC